MTKDDKYGLFRQFMFNELQISKEDIRNWIKEAVEQQVEKMLHKTYGDFEPNEILNEIKKRLIPKEKMVNLERIFKQERIN